MPTSRIWTSARTIAGSIAIAALALSTMSAIGQTVPQMVQKKLADNVYMMEHPTGSSNSTFIVTDEGVFVWDADIRTGDQVMAAIRRTTDKKVKYLAISHPSGDHATGA